MEPYADILSSDPYGYTTGTTGGAKPSKPRKKKADPEDEEKLSGAEQINKVLHDKKDIYLSKVTRENVKNIRFRTPMILVAKSQNNPKKFFTYNVFFIRYDKDTEGIWYSFIDPWQVAALTQTFATMAKTQKILWQGYFKFQEKFLSLGLINFDETYILKI